jgi:hypothetical protein
MANSLDREALISGLAEVLQRARLAGIVGVTIRIVGGAALRLSYFDRAMTADIDARIEPLDPLLPLVREIAAERGWPDDWLNDRASQFIPHLGRAVEWKSLHYDKSVSISVAPIDALLAMKLAAARPGRDTDDITKLLRLNDIADIDAAEELLEAFYPGDALPDRTLRLLARIFERGLPPTEAAPPRPKFE